MAPSDSTFYISPSPAARIQHSVTLLWLWIFREFEIARVLTASTLFTFHALADRRESRSLVECRVWPCGYVREGLLSYGTRAEQGGAGQGGAGQGRAGQGGAGQGKGRTAESWSLASKGGVGEWARATTAATAATAAAPLIVKRKLCD